jgi:hypothetical protein
MRLVSTAEAGTDPLGQLVASQQTRGLDDGALGVHPLGLDRIEPRTLAGQVAHHAKRAHAPTLPFYLTALLANPGRHGLAAMPRRIVPDQGQSLDTLADTHDTQNDNPFVALAFAGDRPLVAFQAVLGYDANNFATGTVWSVTSSDGVTWDPVVGVPDDGGQIGDGPFPLAATLKGAALAETVSGGNLDGTKCGVPKVARTTDFKSWATCSPDADASLSLNPLHMDAVFGSDGRLSLVIQNRLGGQLPAGVLFWREK